jgi:hypothetical protein
MELARPTTSFGGAVIGTATGVSVDPSNLGPKPSTPSAGKTRKTMGTTSTVAASGKQRTDTVVKHHKVTADDIKLSSDIIGAALTIKHAFGSQPTIVDSICSYGVHANVSGDKENADRVLFRVGKQVCVLTTDSSNPTTSGQPQVIQSQQYFDGRNRRVKNVLHFTVSQVSSQCYFGISAPRRDVDCGQSTEQ